MKLKYGLQIILPIGIIIVISLVFIYKIFVYKKTYLYSDEYYVKIAKFLQNSGDELGALYHYKKALEVNSNNIDVHNALGCIYFKRKENDYVMHHLRKLTILKPNDALCFYNLGFVQYSQGYINDAIATLEKAIQLNPNHLNAYKWLEFSCLMVGDLDKGYKIKEAAHKQKVTQNMRDPEWEGTDLYGKTVLIMDNIGMGDVFCFIRYAKALKERGAKVIFGTRNYLRPILSQFSYIDAFVERFKEVPKFDVLISMDMLPLVAHRYLKDFKSEIPYLQANETLVKKWKKKLTKDQNFKVGICWHSAMYKNEIGKIQKNRRAMPLHYFYSLGKLPGVSLYSLQQMHGVEQIAHMPQDFQIKTFDETFDKDHGSFMDTAAVMKNLDLVITVDTSIAHLAGALGVPVWVILPYVPDWRWLLGRSDTDLYPTMRLFRQAQLDDWESAMKEVMNKLEIMLKKRSR